MLKEATNKVWGFPYADLVMGCHMANPQMFQSYGEGRSLSDWPITQATTPAELCESHQILQALMNQELIVAHEIFMTPTAMLADYILPGDVLRSVIMWRMAGAGAAA